MSSPSKSSSQPRSVVYVMGGRRVSVNERGLVEAQRYARAHQLPLAVVGIVNERVSDEEWSHLTQAETELADLNIPLMLLIGERGSVLRSLSGHVEPRLFMQDAGIAELELPRHPYLWPGHVEPVESIKALSVSHSGLCFP